MEIWGRGTNRVIEECKQYGIDPPAFEETSDAVVVTFRVPVGPGPGKGPGRHQVGTKSALSEHQVIVLTMASDPQPVKALMKRCGRSDRTKFRNQVIKPLLHAGLLAMTIPDKPQSSKQRYRVTEAGKKILAKLLP